MVWITSAKLCEPGHRGGTRVRRAAWCGKRVQDQTVGRRKIAALAGIVIMASMGQTQAALAIGIIALAFFSRVGC
jgi:hypothetical protein